MFRECYELLKSNGHVSFAKLEVHINFFLYFVPLFNLLSINLKSHLQGKSGFRLKDSTDQNSSGSMHPRQQNTQFFNAVILRNHLRSEIIHVN